MSRFFARRRLFAVGLIVALASPLAASTAGASIDSFSPVSFRDSGPRVLLAQRVLDVAPRTGVFNKETRRHVRQFQDRRGFAVTGVINERTWNALLTRWESIVQARQRRDAKYQRVMKVARNQKGDPYVYGATGPNAASTGLPFTLAVTAAVASGSPCASVRVWILTPITKNTNSNILTPERILRRFILLSFSSASRLNRLPTSRYTCANLSYSSVLFRSCIASLLYWKTSAVISSIVSSTSALSLRLRSG